MASPGVELNLLDPLPQGLGTDVQFPCDLPLSWTSRTASARNSGGYGGRDAPMWTSCSDYVNSKSSGIHQTGSSPSTPSQQNAELVWRMEHVLAVYQRPYDPARPVVHVDEVSKKVLRDVRAPLPPSLGQPRRIDYGYERAGAINLFLACEPLAGLRWVTVTERRTKVDFAQQIKELVDLHYPDATQIVLV